jgi:hypothetical protein
MGELEEQMSKLGRKLLKVEAVTEKQPSRMRVCVSCFLEASNHPSHMKPKEAGAEDCGPASLVFTALQLADCFV